MNTCSVEGCENKIYGRALCHFHYDQYRRKGVGMPPTKGAAGRTCSVPGCNEKHAGRGYCVRHYQALVPISERNRRNPDHICSVEGCGKPYYAKGYCHKHHTKYHINGHKPHYDYKCSAPNCEILTTQPDSYCAFHQRRIDTFGPEFVVKRHIARGDQHWRWKGGIADYANHSEMKRIRKIKLESVNYVCEECGGKATEVHHRDKTKTNHDISNLIAVCHKCHFRVYHSEPHKRKYGELSIQEMSEQCGVSTATMNKYLKGKRVGMKSYLKIAYHFGSQQQAI